MVGTPLFLGHKVMLLYCALYMEPPQAQPTKNGLTWNFVKRMYVHKNVRLFGFSAPTNASETNRERQRHKGRIATSAYFRQNTATICLQVLKTFIVRFHAGNTQKMFTEKHAANDFYQHATPFCSFESNTQVFNWSKPMVIEVFKVVTRPNANGIAIFSKKHESRSTYWYYLGLQLDLLRRSVGAHKGYQRMHVGTLMHVHTTGITSFVALHRVIPWYRVSFYHLWTLGAQKGKCHQSFPVLENTVPFIVNMRPHK